jgi:hypothetical protein
LPDGVVNLWVSGSRIWSEGLGVLRRGEAGDARLLEGLEVVDGVLGEVAQPLLLGLVVVVVDAEPVGELGEDRAVVAAFVHRLDGLLHVDRVMAGAGPRRVDVVALPEGRGRPAGVGPDGERLLPLRGAPLLDRSI